MPHFPLKITVNMLDFSVIMHQLNSLFFDRLAQLLIFANPLKNLVCDVKRWNVIFFVGLKAGDLI